MKQTTSTAALIARYAGACVALLALAACERAPEDCEITTRRKLSEPVGTGGIGMPLAARMRLRQPANPHASSPPQQELPRFEYETPAGWKELPASARRPVNLLVEGNPEAECYLSYLQGTGGGLVPNVNRWRRQMGLDPLDQGDEQALRGSTMPLLGGEAIHVSMEGQFTSMGEAQARPGYRLEGLILEVRGGMIFMKMTGPAELIAKELPSFEKLCSSIRFVESPAAPADHSGARSSGLAWKLPEGWERLPASSMRLANFGMGAGIECYVSTLSGAAGSPAGIVNMWRQQMGQAAVDEAALAALQRIKVLGRDSLLVELEGPYTAMGASQAAEGYEMLGMICPVAEGHSLYAKLVGPRDEVQKQREHFIAFCESIAEEQG